MATLVEYSREIHRVSVFSKTCVFFFPRTTGIERDFPLTLQILYVSIFGLFVILDTRFWSRLLLTHKVLAYYLC